MDMQSLIESFGVLAIAPGIAIYLHQSFVKITQQMMQAMMAESKADREVFYDTQPHQNQLIQTILPLYPREVLGEGEKSCLFQALFVLFL